MLGIGKSWQRLLLRIRQVSVLPRATGQRLRGVGAALRL